VVTQKIGGAACDLDCEFDVRPGQNRLQIGFAGDKNIGDLGFNLEQAANPVFQRCEIACDVNVQVGAARIGHGIALELVDILEFEELVRDCRLQNAKVNSIARIQFLGLEFPQAVLKTAKTLQFGIERKPAEIIRPAIVFMETKPSCKKRARVQVTFDELFRHRAEIGIGVLRGVKRRNDREKDEEEKSFHRSAAAGR